MIRVTVALLALCLATTCTANRRQPSTEELFGAQKVLVDVQRPEGVRLVAGLAAGEFGDDLLLAGAVKDGKEWRVRLLDALPSGYDQGRGCSAESAPDLVPGGEVIVAGCITGGTNRVGYVAVLGVNDETRKPAVLLVTSCGVTTPQVEGKTLRIKSSGPKAGSADPGAQQPDLGLVWDGSSLSATDFDSYRSYCKERGAEFGFGH